MIEETQIIEKKDSSPSHTQESQLMGVSIRAWLAVMLVFTICAMAYLRTAVTEPLYTISIMAVSFYFGQKSPNQNPGQIHTTHTTTKEP